MKQRSRHDPKFFLPKAFAGMVALGLCIPAVSRADYQGSQHVMPYNEAPINYDDAKPTDPVARLQQRLEKGEVKLRYEDKHGYLLALLEELKIPLESQMLVFSKTSLQRNLISPHQPRAVFFNDDVYVGWVKWGSLLEISAADPKKGGMFYVLAQTESNEPRLVRNQSCLECHVSSKTLGVPGHLFRSFDTDAEGVPDESTGGEVINHNSPMSERWGGWYVTGRHGKHGHRGNLPGPAARANLASGTNTNLADLKGFIDPAQYPRPDSDIVALMVFGHQVHMHNFITRLNYEATIQISQYGDVKYMGSAVDAFLRYLLFQDEPPVLSRIEGTSGFASQFSAQGPKDGQGRSLRELDLYTRLFKYRCSYLIYSEAFDSLPQKLRDLIYRRLWDALHDRDPNISLPAHERTAIREILTATKEDLPGYWLDVEKVQSAPLVTE